MAGFAFSADGDHGAKEGVRHPTTDPESKSVMLRGELQDEVKLLSVEHKLSEDHAVPGSVVIRQRTNTYYGPKLLAVAESGREYLLTAPGPDRYLILWGEELHQRGGRTGWVKVAEVRCKLAEDHGGYHLCHQCNEPLKTAEHQRLARVGQCPNIS